MTNSVPRGYLPSGVDEDARLADSFIYANGNDAIEALARVRHHLASFSRDKPEFDSKLLTQFAPNASEAGDELKR